MFDQLGSAILAKPVPTAIAELVRQIEPAKVAWLWLGSAHTAAETLPQPGGSCEIALRFEPRSCVCDGP